MQTKQANCEHKILYFLLVFSFQMFSLTDEWQAPQEDHFIQFYYGNGNNSIKMAYLSVQLQF